MAVSTRTKRSATRPLIVTLIVIVVIAALGFGYASPYMALNNLKRAADARDAQTVNEYVDFPALRESLKQQVTGLLTRRLDAHGNGNPFAAIGAMIGVALIGPLVDAYATPDGVAALLNGMPPRGNPGERPPVPPAASGACTGTSTRLLPAIRLTAQLIARTVQRHRNRRKPRRAIAASMSSSSPISMVRVTRVTRRSCGAKVCSHGSWPRSI